MDGVKRDQVVGWGNGTRREGRRKRGEGRRKRGERWSCATGEGMQLECGKPMALAPDRGR